jgi:hypothetical protein
MPVQVRPRPARRPGSTHYPARPVCGGAGLLPRRRVGRARHPSAAAVVSDESAGGVGAIK